MGGLDCNTCQATTTKLLKDLSERDLVKEKVSGKQAVYHIIQDPKDAAAPEELKEMALKIESIKSEITTLKSEKKKLEAEITALQLAPTFIALQHTIKQLQADIASLSSHLEPLRTGMVAPVSATEKASVDNDLFKYEKLQKARGKMFRELWSLAVESGEQNSKELWERLGLEDEWIGVL